jgi:hypothetical protein
MCIFLPCSVAYDWAFGASNLWFYFQTPRFLAAKMKRIGQIRCFCLETGAFHPIPDGKMTILHPPLNENRKTHLWCD